jgi:sortase A
MVRTSITRAIGAPLGVLALVGSLILWPADAPASQAGTLASAAAPSVHTAPSVGTVIATLRIPRFGAEYAEPIGEGIGEAAVLNTMIGHFPGTAMPGQPGNFALAGHRVTYGKPFNLIGSLVIGDPIVVETAEGQYLYRFRASEYVQPSAIDVTYPVPRQQVSVNSDAVITFVACNPLFSTAERIIAYGVFESFTPAGAEPAPVG